jgi:hypothetical protein
VGLLGAAVLAFFHGVLEGRVLVAWDLLRREGPWSTPGPVHNLYLADTVRLYAPWRMLLGEALRHGRLPTWDPYVFAGTPFLANSQAAVLYPPNILYALLPVDSATTALVLVHALWAGVGTYLLARRTDLRASYAASLVAAVGFAFSGFADVWAELPTFMATLSWLPWVFLGLFRLHRRPGWLPVAGTAVAVALGALAGHAQLLQYELLATGAAAAVLAAASPARRRARFGLLAGAGVGLGLLLAAPQLLSTVEAGGLIVRQHEELAHLVKDALRPDQLVLAALPRYFGDSQLGTWTSRGDENEFVLFAGLLPLLLAPLSLARARRPAVLALLAATILMLAIMLGTPVFTALYQLPTMDKVRGLARASSAYSMLVPLLGAIGLDVLMGWRQTRPRAFAAWIVAAPLALGTLALLDRQAGHTHGFGRDLMLAQYAGLLVPALGVVVLLAGALAGRARAATLLLPGLVFAELFLAYGDFNTADHGPATLARPTAMTAFLSRNPGRVTSFQSYELTGNTPAAYRLEALQGSDSFILTRFADVFNLVEERRHDFVVNEAPPLDRAPSLDSPLLDLLGVRWVLTRADAAAVVGAAGIDPHPALDGTDRVFTRPNALELATAVCLQRVGSEHEVLATLAAEGTGTVAHTAVTTGVSPACDEGAAPGAKVGPARFLDDGFTIPVSARGPVVVRLAEVSYPGWGVSVDGRPAMLLELDHALMGVAVPAGRHQVRFAFQPRWLLPGTALAGAALLLTGLAAAAGLRRPGQGAEAAEKAGSSTASRT